MTYHFIRYRSNAMQICAQNSIRPMPFCRMDAMGVGNPPRWGELARALRNMGLWSSAAIQPVRRKNALQRCDKRHSLPMNWREWAIKLPFHRAKNALLYRKHDICIANVNCYASYRHSGCYVSCVPWNCIRCFAMNDKFHSICIQFGDRWVSFNDPRTPPTEPSIRYSRLESIVFFMDSFGFSVSLK